jgi:nitroreductase
MDILQAIRERRSIRRYKPDPISDVVLEKVLEAARWAPSWKNTQCQRFLVVRDKGTKNKLADALIADPKIGPTNPSDMAIRIAPVVVVAFAQMGLSGYNNGKLDTDKGENWYLFDVGLAMQNLMLAAHALGLATVPAGLSDATKVAKILNIPDGYQVVTMTPLGYPDVEPKDRPRKELAEVVYYEKFDYGG